MSWVDWHTLGIDPTTDRGAIRRAYATRLKAMDVDADPDGFAELREARDAALAEAAGMAAAPEPVVEAVTVPPPVPEPAIDPREAASHAAIEAHFHALESLLFPGHDAPPTPDELAAIEHHGRAMLADPRLERVDFAAGAERWFAERLAASVPRSDPLLEPAAATFGWIERRDEYALSAEALAVVERIGATRFAARVGDPSHRLHRAWRELNRDDATRRPWRNPKHPRRELLSIVRSSYPQVEGWLNPARVAEVEQAGADQVRRAGLPWWGIIIVATTLLRVAFGTGNSSAPPPVRTPVPTVERSLFPAPDADAVARRLTGRDLAQVSAANPGLGRDIRATIETLDGASDPHLADTTLDALMRRRTAAGLAEASDGLLRDIARFELSAKRDVADIDPVRCRDFIFPAGDALLTPAQRERQAALLHRVVLESDDRDPRGDDRYRVPGSIMGDIAATTGLPRARIDEALSAKGEHDDVCRVQIAVRQAALAAGKTGTTLLRDMQS